VGQVGTLTVVVAREAEVLLRRLDAEQRQSDVAASVPSRRPVRLIEYNYLLVRSGLGLNLIFGKHEIPAAS